MVQPVLGVFDRIKSVGDFQREADEFNARKQQAALQRELAKAQIGRVSSGGDLPSTIQIANEIEKAVRSGDIERANLLHQVHKTMDKGINPYGDPYGEPFQYPNDSQDPMSASQNAITQRQAEIGANPYQNELEVMPMQLADVERAIGYQPQPMQGYGEAVGSIEATKKRMEEEAAQRVRSVYEPMREADIATRKANVELQYGPQIAGAERKASIEQEVQAENQKKTRQDTGTMGAIQRAREYLPNATSGNLQNILSTGARAVGKSTDQTKADAQLKIVAAELVGNVPRFEGPQSNIDVQFYKDAAADVGNPELTREDRAAALDAIEQRILLRREQGLLNEDMNANQQQAPMSLFESSQNEFNNKKTPRLKYNPATGEFE